MIKLHNNYDRFTVLYCLLQEYLHSWNSAETKNFNHHPTNEIPSGNHINFTHVCRCLRVLKQQFINALKHDLKNSMLENTIFFSGRVSKDISLVVSICTFDIFERIISQHLLNILHFLYSSLIRVI